MDAAILYSNAASASTSAVAAFAKCNDLLVVDELIYEPLCTGVTLSHATVKHFCESNMDHLENILKHQKRWIASCIARMRIDKNSLLWKVSTSILVPLPI
eukprot:2315487-Ditylum_brightwellii.AAC.1